MDKIDDTDEFMNPKENAIIAIAERFGITRERMEIIVEETKDDMKAILAQTTLLDTQSMQTLLRRFNDLMWTKYQLKDVRTPPEP